MGEAGPVPTTDLHSAYVSRMLLARLAEDRPFSGPESAQLPCAVLFSDIQGFTQLVESFTAAGGDGIEALTWTLNAYFADLVDLVYGYGGDVLYVAGDAFFCVWPASSFSGLEDAVLHAAKSGLEIQARLDQRAAGGGLHFATRIGIGAGELSVAYAGGVGGRWEAIATGEALRDVIDAEKHCAPGQVVLSRAAWRLAQRACRGRDAGEHCVTLQGIDEPPALRTAPPQARLDDAEARLRPFLPPAVLDRLLMPHTDWLAEQRRVTVVLADLPALADANPGNLAHMHEGVRAFQEMVLRFEGTIKVDVDDKGILLLAVFGLPPKAHEDDAVRAIHAAWALRDALEALGAHGGIGIATGRAFCGAFGSELRREYMVRGDVINLAARLMQLEPALIRCDRYTADAAGARVQFEALAAVVLKGRAEPVQAFRPVARGARATRADARLVGRVAEEALLAAQLAQLAEGGGGTTVLVLAEAGLGKSALVASLLRSAGASRVRSFTAAADAIERSTPYFAWRSVFAGLLGLSGEEDLPALETLAAARVERLESLARLAPLLGAVLPLRVPDNDLTAEMTGEVRADNTQRLLAALLQDAARANPLLLLVEDAQWLDSASLALLNEIARSVQSILLVVTSRPDETPAPAGPGRLAQVEAGHVLRLDSLSDGDIVTMIGRQLGVEEVPQMLAEFVRSRVNGHPFFCEELLRAMLQSGAVRVDAGRCTLGELDALDLPTTVEGVIVSRLDRLAPGEQLCIKVASVAGRSFRERTVRDICPADAERARVGAHLEALVGATLTVADAPAPDASYLFKHLITRDVTYESMPLVQRKPLHRALASWHETNFADALSPHYALLAHHWARAGEAAKSVAYLERAGQQSLHDGAFGEALKFFNQVIQQARDGGVEALRERRATWEKGLGTAHYFLGELGPSRKHLEQAVALLDRPIPPTLGAVTRALAREALRQAAHRLFPKRFLGRRAGEKTMLDEAVECYKVLGQIYYLDGEPAPRLLYLTVRGVNIGEQGGPSLALARILSNMSVAAGLAGVKAWADHYASHAIRMAESQGQYAAAAYVWHIHALKEAQFAHWAGAHASNEKAMALIRELGDFNLEAEAWVVRATVCICEGDFRAAPAAWTRARELAQRNRNAQILCWSMLDEVDTLLGRGKTEDAARVLDEALAIPTAESDGSSTIDKQRARAMTRCRQGRHAEAVEAADAVLDLIERQPPTGYHWADFLASAVEVYLSVLESRSDYARSQRDILLERGRRGCRMLRKLSSVFWNVRPRCVLLEGLLDRVRDRRPQAMRRFRQCAQRALQMNMPFERARALLEVARSGAAPEERDALLDEAGAIFERLGAGHFLADAAAAAPKP